MLTAIVFQTGCRFLKMCDRSLRCSYYDLVGGQSDYVPPAGAAKGHSGSRRRTATFGWALIAAVIPLSTARAGDYFMDTFNDGALQDGNPVSWQNGYYDPAGASRDVSSGDLVMVPNQDGAAFVAVVDGQTYADASLRTQLRLVDGRQVGFPGLMLRTSGPEFYYGGISEQGVLGLGQCFVDETCTEYANASTSLDPVANDVHLQFDAFGKLLSLYAWQEGQTKPRTPQILWADSGLVEGQVGVFHAPNDRDQTKAVFRSFEVAPAEAPPSSVGPLAFAATLLGTAQDRDQDGMGDAFVIAMLRVGEQDISQSQTVNRSLLKFDLPDVPFELDSAALRVYLRTARGTPGPLSLFHSVSDNDLTPLITVYEDATYADTTRDLLQETDITRQFYEVDVTDLVRLDYLNDVGKIVAAFRLESSDTVFVEDDQSHYYQLDVGINEPQLIVTFVPEPSTAVLICLGLVHSAFGRGKNGKGNSNRTRLWPG